ncbi:hypothetical protein SDC9_178225 [bioreactor metagenome]|uniref:Uncharacterized protein n=1 Tax=bioreactor metagenome TaxID=1076179 RepID=A0A645H370_9ZZZZ
MAGGVHDVDAAILIVYSRVFGENGDTPLPLQISTVHHPLLHLFVCPEHAALAQKLIHHGGLPMVDMGDDGDVADGFVGHIQDTSIFIKIVSFKHKKVLYCI